MENLLIKTTENQIQLLQGIDEDLKELFGQIKLSDFIDDPTESLQELSITITQLVLDKHKKAFIDEGKRFSRDIKSHKRVEFIDTNDPTANKELINADNANKT